MILKVGGRNYKSFKNEFELDFIYKNKIGDSQDVYSFNKKYFTQKENKVIKTCLIAGKNASGKTNIFHFLSHFKDAFLIYNKHIWNFSPYLFSNEEKESLLFIQFIHKGILFDYECVVDTYKKIVISESLKYKFGDDTIKKAVVIVKDDLKYYDEDFLGLSKDIILNVLKSNHQKKSIIQLLVFLNCNIITTVFIDFFQKTQIFVDNYRCDDTFSNCNIIILKKYLKSIRDNSKKNLKMEKDIINLINKFLKSLDLGIEGIGIIEQRDLTYQSFDLEANEEFDELKNYSLVTLHKTSNGDVVNLNLDSESSGNKKIIELSLALILSLIEPNIILIDEFTNYLHEKLIENIIYLFRRYSKGSQLIFSTHNSNILDMDFKKEMIFIADNKNGVTTISSLKSEKFRNDISKAKLYINGKLGSTINDSIVDFENLLLNRSISN